MKEFILEKSYTPLGAFGVLDLGLDRNEEIRYTALTSLDADKDGNISDEEKNVAYEILNKRGVEDGATVIPKSLCLDFSGGGETAKDDTVRYFQAGEKISGLDGIETSLIKFLVSNGLIIGSRFIKADGSLDIEKLDRETEKSDDVEMAGFINIPEKYVDGYNQAKVLFGFLKQTYPVVKPASIVFSLTDYLLEKKFIEFTDSKERDSFFDLVLNLG